MNRLKRTISAILAIVILLGTLGWVIALVVNAAENTVRYGVEKIYSAGGSPLGTGYIQSGYLADITVQVTGSYTIGFSGDLTVSVGGSFSTTSGNTPTVTDRSTVDSVDYTVKLPKIKYSGQGNSLFVTVQDASGHVDTQLLNIDYCKPKEDSSSNRDDDDTSAAVATPYLIVSNYNYGGAITAGQKFSLSITFKNTSTGTDIENVMMTLTMPEGLALTSSSNTFYFPEVQAEESITKVVEVQARPSAKQESQQVKIEFKYQYLTKTTWTDGTTGETIAIPVVQPDRFAADPIELPEQVMVGEEICVTANYINKGRGEIYNLSAEIQGNVANPGQRQNIGNVEAGKSGSVDFYVTCNESGRLSGNVIFTYEDENMQIKTITVPYSAEMMGGMEGEFPDKGEFPGMPTFPEDEIPPAGGLPGWAWWAIGGGCLLVAGIVVLVVLRKRRDARLMAELMAEDEEYGLPSTPAPVAYVTEQSQPQPALMQHAGVAEEAEEAHETV